MIEVAAILSVLLIAQMSLHTTYAYSNETFLFINQTDNLIVYQKYGQHVHLPCIIHRKKDQHANQQAYVIWSKLSNQHQGRPKILTIGLQQLTQDMRFRVKMQELSETSEWIVENWQLEIRKLNYDDESVYQCQLPLIQPQSKQILLKIKHDLSLTIDRDPLVQQDEPLKLKCGLTLNRREAHSNNTKHLLQWYKNNHKIHGNFNTQIISNTNYLLSELSISQLRLLHEGNYSCEFNETREFINIKFANKKDSSIEYYIFNHNSNNNNNNSSNSNRNHAIYFLFMIMLAKILFYK